MDMETYTQYVIYALFNLTANCSTMYTDVCLHGQSVNRLNLYYGTRKSQIDVCL